MKKVVVTGGAGFIGSHLAESLASREYQVIILDDLSTGKVENITGLLRKDNVQFVQKSITDLPLLQKIFQGVDYVFHQAALARVLRSIEDPLTVNVVNITGTLNVLLAARDNAVKKVVFASSSSIYGGTPILPQREDMPPDPLSPYALTKLTGEFYGKIFHNIYGLSTVSLRYFNVYGSRQDPHTQYSTAVIAFISRAARNLPPIIYGDGEQSRDFTFVEDVVQANILAAENNAEGVFNIASGRNFTVNQLAQIILSLMQKNLTPIYEPPRAGDPRQTLGDISRARAFGYDPKWTLETGLRKIVKEFKQ